MPRRKALHLNNPADDEHTVCGRQLAKTDWTLQPAQVTCLACKTQGRTFYTGPKGPLDAHRDEQP